MPIKVMNAEVKFLSGAVSLAQIQEMVNAYKKDFRKKGDSEIARRHPRRPHKTQSSCVWLSKDELLKLLEENKGNGIRIYFGQHTKKDTPGGDPDYEDLLTPIFVATQDNTNLANPTSENSEDQLKENLNSVTIPGWVSYVGNGLDQVPICNPRCPTTMMKIVI